MNVGIIYVTHQRVNTISYGKQLKMAASFSIIDEKTGEPARRPASTITSYKKISHLLLSKHTPRHSSATHLLENLPLW